MTTPTPPNFDDLEARLRAAGVADEASLRAALERDPQLATDLRDFVESNSLLQALEAFIGAETWGESQRVLEQHPELLSDEALATLDQLIAAARAQGDVKVEQRFTEHRDLLQRCRAAGVQVVFGDDKISQMEEATTQTAEASSSNIPPRFRTDLRQAHAAEDRYLNTGDRFMPDEAIAAWERILAGLYP
ncbi:MAG: hypothetical protein RMN52_16165 [Anaerolineae bacterium]|nr:hypothetical protein [Candidatus Roseilinea sp.]MDW8451535.1 hypothetical protein [Anaerolineae bacterium]